MPIGMGRATSIKSARETAGFSTDELSMRLNVPVSDIESWESGKATVPYEHRSKLANLLGVSVDQITTGGADTS